jgi:hypothetical protein
MGLSECWLELNGVRTLEFVLEYFQSIMLNLYCDELKIWVVDSELKRKTTGNR